jgi:hypothetical protein
MQQRHGLEYSQLSRFIKCAWLHIYVNWGLLVTNNFVFFVPRKAAYCQSIQDKFAAVNPGVALGPQYADAALFSDGTKRRHHHDAGHKRFYCFGYMVTVAPDGIIVDVQGPYAGRRNDHDMQNACQLSARLLAAQQSNQRIYDTSTDKGLHTQLGVVTMYNNIVNTPFEDASNTCWSPMRVANENIIGLPPNTWRYLDSWKLEALGGFTFAVFAVAVVTVSCGVGFHRLVVVIARVLNTQFHNLVSWLMKASVLGAPS